MAAPATEHITTNISGALQKLAANKMADIWSLLTALVSITSLGAWLRNFPETTRSGSDFAETPTESFRVGTTKNHSPTPSGVEMNLTTCSTTKTVWKCSDIVAVGWTQPARGVLPENIRSFAR